MRNKYRQTQSGLSEKSFVRGFKAAELLNRVWFILCLTSCFAMSACVIEIPYTESAELLQSITSGAGKRHPTCLLWQTKILCFWKMPQEKTSKRQSYAQNVQKCISFFFFLRVAHLFSCSWDQRSAELFGHSPRHVFVGVLDLRVVSAGVGELFSWVGIVQIPPHPRHFRWDVVVTILLSDNLEETGKQELMSQSVMFEITNAFECVSKGYKTFLHMATWELGKILFTNFRVNEVLE